MIPIRDIDGLLAVPYGATTMIVEPFHRGYRIEVIAEDVDGPGRECPHPCALRRTNTCWTGDTPVGERRAG
jgi:hypothetical protein